MDAIIEKIKSHIQQTKGYWESVVDDYSEDLSPESIIAELDEIISFIDSISKE